LVFQEKLTKLFLDLSIVPQSANRNFLCLTLVKKNKQQNKKQSKKQKKNLFLNSEAQLGMK